MVAIRPSKTGRGRNAIVARRREMPAMIACVLGVLLACLPAAFAQDWVIGQSDPNEQVTLSSDRLVNGDVIVVNNGRLAIRNGATLTVTGDVQVFGHGVLTVDNATIHFPQTYAYQSGLLMGDQATVQLTDAVMDPGGRSYSLSLLGDAHAEYTRVTTPNGFATWGFFDTASLNMVDCSLGGEFLEFGSNDVSISGTDTVLFWLTMPDGAVVDTTLPASGAVTSFVLDPNTPWASGIPYRFSLSNATNVLWGVLARSGSSGTFRGSDLRTVGTYFEQSSTVTISSVVNGAHLTDMTYDWGPIQLRFVDTTVQVWNFYSSASTQLSLDHCIFGEAQAYQNSQLTIQQSLCDGMGGYIQVSENATLVFYLSTNLSQTTATDNGVFIGVSSALLGADNDAVDNAIMALLETEYTASPRASDAGTIFDVAIDAVAAIAGDVTELRGTAQLLRGPQSPVVFDGYQVEYATAADPNALQPVVGPVAAEVRDGPLGVWDTCGLTPGAYILRLSLLFNGTDSLVVTAPAALNQPTACVPGDVDCDRDIDVVDLGATLANFGRCAGQSGYDPNADANGDGCVNIADLAIVLAAFGGVCL